LSAADPENAHPAQATARRLGAEPYVSLGTFRRDGREVRTPVWIAEEGGVLYVYTNRRSGKVKRLRREPRVRLVPCDVRGGLRGDPVEARGALCEDEAEAARGFAALRRKYGWQLRAVLFASRLGGRYADRGILALRIAEGGGPDEHGAG